MRDVFGPGTILGYCTNVHAGRSLEEIMQQLERHAVAVKARVSPNQAMGIGLWFHAQAAHDLVFVAPSLVKLQQWLDERALAVHTINGFPYGDFHARTVKHDVYRPNWTTHERSEYTANLALILDSLLPDGGDGSISTLPIGWARDQTDGWEDYIASTVCFLTELHSKSGKTIHLDLEPEPGCTLQRSTDVVQHFESLLIGRDEDPMRRHLRVCHDICHAAVMFEDQAEMFARYKAAGIKIGKVQISNAIRADLRSLSARERTDAIAQLRQFSEDRYLHQTMIRDGEGFRFFDDLPRALAEFGESDLGGDEWRVHFHVPIYLDRFGLLQTTRDHIIECMRLLRNSDVKHWEVETYAWNVLPEDLKVPDLAEGIAREMMWVIEQAKAMR